NTEADFLHPQILGGWVHYMVTDSIMSQYSSGGAEGGHKKPGLRQGPAFPWAFLRSLGKHRGTEFSHPYFLGGWVHYMVTDSIMSQYTSGGAEGRPQKVPTLPGVLLFAGIFSSPRESPGTGFPPLHFRWLGALYGDAH